MAVTRQKAQRNSTMTTAGSRRKRAEVEEIAHYDKDVVPDSEEEGEDGRESATPTRKRPRRTLERGSSEQPSPPDVTQSSGELESCLYLQHIDNAYRNRTSSPDPRHSRQATAAALFLMPPPDSPRHPDNLPFFTFNMSCE